MGGLDTLAMIAGNTDLHRPENIASSDIDRVFNLHVKGTMFSNAAAFRALRERGGSIINFSSGAGVSGEPNAAIYSAAKAAVLRYTRAAALAWGEYLIRVMPCVQGR